MGKEYELAIKIAGKLDSSFGAAINQASIGLKTLGAVGTVIGTSVKVAAGAFGAVTTAVAAAGGASVKVGKEFEAAMSSVAATANATEEEYTALETAAMEMGRTTSKTASESAAALEYMSLAGWNVEQSIAGLPSVLRLSEATGLGLARASDLVTDSMAALGLTVNDLSGYLDIAARAQNKSNQSAEELMEAYLGVGGTMNNLHVPIAESATALGVLANRGIKGSEAGTALNAIMVNLTTGTGRAGDAMKALGVSAFDSEGNFIGLEATLQQLNSALANCTEEQRNAYLAAIGGKTHVDALNDLMAGLNTEVADGVTEWAALEAELNNANGALDQMASKKLDNLSGDLAIFSSALEDAGIKIYKHLQEPLRDVVQFGTEEIYKLSDALVNGGFSGMAEALGGVLSDSIQQLASYASGFFDIVGTVASGLLSGIAENASTIGPALAGTLTSLLTNFINFYGQFYSTGAALLAQFLQGMAERFPEITASVMTMGRGLCDSLTAQFPDIVSSASQMAFQLINTLAASLPMFIETGATLISQLATGLAQAAPKLIPAAVNAVLRVVESIGNQVPQLLSAGITLIDGLLQGILAGLDAFFTAGPEVIVNLVNGIVSALPTLIAQAGQVIIAFVTGLIRALPQIVSGAVQIINGLVQGLVQALPQIITVAAALIMYLAKAILENLPTIIESGIQLITALLEGIIQAIPQLIAALPGLLAAIGEAFMSIDWIGLGMKVLKAIGDGMVQGFAALTAVVTTGWNAVKSVISTVWAAIVSVVSAKVNAVKTVVTTVFNAVKSFASTAWNAVKSVVSSVWESIVSAVTTKVNAVKSNVSTGFNNIKSVVSTVLGAVKSTVSSIFDSIRSAISEKINAAKSVVSSGLNAIKGFFAGLTLKLPHIKLPHFKITGTLSLDPPSVPHLSIDWYKQGGILSGAQIFGAMGGSLLGGGEAGKEAVLPLSTLWDEMGRVVSDAMARPESGAGITELSERLDSMAAGRRDGYSIDWLSDRLADRSGSGRDSPGAQGYTINYSPTLQFSGGTPSREDIVEAGRISQKDFNDMMDNWMKTNSRRAFG